MKKYTLEVIVQAYRIENPDLTEESIQEKAKLLHKQINVLDSYWNRSKSRFRKMNELV